MAYYSDVITDNQTKAPRAGVNVTVLKSDGTLASLTDNSGGAIVNPTSSNSTGFFFFNAADAVYTLEYRYGGRLIRQDEVIVGSPPQFAGPAGPPGPDLVLRSNLLLNTTGNGASLIGNLGGGTVQDALFVKGPTTPITGNTSKINWLREAPSPTIPARLMGGLWPTDKVTWDHVFSSEFDATNAPATTTTTPSSAVTILAHNKGTFTNMCSLQAIASVQASGFEAAGVNFITYSNQNLSNVIMKGMEIDIQPGSGTTVADCFGIALNAFTIQLPGDAINIGGVFGGRWGSGVKVGALNPTTGAGIYGVGGMGALLNSATGTYAVDAVVLSNTHATRYLAANGSAARIYADSSNFLRIVMPTAGIVIRNTTDVATAIAIDQVGNIDLQGGGVIFYKSSALFSTATAGAASLPSNPAGFVAVKVGTSSYKFPIYNA